MPESESIYYKDFHFLEEPLIEKQQKKDEAKRLKKLADLQTGKPIGAQDEKLLKVTPAQTNALPIFSN